MPYLHRQRRIVVERAGAAVIWTPRKSIVQPRRLARRQRGLFLPAAFVGDRYLVDAVDFNGSTQYLYWGSALSGVSDSGTGIFSAWGRLDGGNNLNMRFMQGENSLGTLLFFAGRTATNKWGIQGAFPA